MNDEVPPSVWDYMSPREVFLLAALVTIGLALALISGFSPAGFVIGGFVALGVAVRLLFLALEASPNSPQRMRAPQV